MHFLFSFLLFFLPTVIMYEIINRKIIIIKSGLLRMSVAWFTGQYISTFITLILANSLNIVTSSVLKKSVFCLILLLISILIFLLKKNIDPSDIKKRLTRPVDLSNILFIILCFLFSSMLFYPQQSYRESKIFISPVYWDFNIHYPVIQSFANGDNFPPQNESFSGIPMTYHYFYYLLVASYSVSGLGLVNALTFMSITTFFFLLISIAGICEEIFDDKKIGYIAALLTITSSSLRFIDYFKLNYSQNIFNLFHILMTSKEHPFFFSFVTGNPFGYNGTMFNLFYFVAERHLIFATMFLIFSFLIIYRRKTLSYVICISAGILMGLFFQWNLATTIIIGCSLSIILFHPKDRKKTMLMLAPFAILFLIQVLYFKSIINPGIFMSNISDYPKVNFDFPTMPNTYPFSIPNAIKYYIYAYGLKIPFIFLGLLILYQKNKNVFILLISIILPTFIVVNSLQLFPLSIWDNHKFLRPMNVFLDLLTAYAILSIFRKRNFISVLGSFILIFFLTISGIIELMPFLNSRPSQFYAKYPTDFINRVRTETPPDSIFLSSSSKELHLAGRVVYLGNSFDEPGAISVIDAAKLDKTKRELILKKIYNAKNIKNFCKLIKSSKIDFITFTTKQKNFPIYKELDSFSHHFGINEKGESIIFVDLQQC